MSERADELLRRIVLCRAWEKLQRNPKSALVRSQASENLWAEVDEYLAGLPDEEGEQDLMQRCLKLKREIAQLQEGMQKESNE